MLQDQILPKNMGGAVLKQSHVFIIYASLQLKSNMEAFLLIFCDILHPAGQANWKQMYKVKIPKEIEVAEIE